MDVHEPQLNITLQEAFTCYLAFLSHNQKLRESTLPRQGKGVETTADLSTQEYFQSRIASIETCLQYTRKIARSVRKWVRISSEDGDDESLNIEAEVVSFDSSFPNGQEIPYLDFFSGKLVQPTTPFSAGPSCGKENASGISMESRKTAQATHHPHKESHDENKSLTSDMPKRKRVPHRKPSQQIGIGIHPNTPITPSSERYVSTSPSVAYSTAPATRVSSIPFSNQEKQADEDDNISVTSEMATAFYLQKIWDQNDAEYAEHIHTKERRRAEEIERSLTQARELADAWAREEKFTKSRLAFQERYAKDIERQERVRAERIKSDREAARKTQEQWEQWEFNAMTQKTEAMRAEERKRREDAEEKRIAEQEKRLKAEREKQRAEQTKAPNLERTRKLSEEKKRREAQNIAEGERRRWGFKSTSKEKAPRKIECVSCMDPGDRKDMAILQCNHAYCGECIKGAFKSAYKSRTPFKCCGQTVLLVSSFSRYLSPSFTQKYNLLLLELSTPKPKYCSSPSCAKFIPPSLIHGPVSTCPLCKTRTCVACGNAEHSGICAEDKEGKKVEALAKKKGWKQCPKCACVVERTAGCLHMTCRCRAEWCYNCLRDWSICGSSCGRSTRMGQGPAVAAAAAAAEPRERGAARNGIGIVPLIATAVLIGLFER